MSPLRAGVLARQSRAKVKSIEDQLDECVEDARTISAVVVGTYTDGVSASRYGRQVRQGYQRLVSDIEAGNLDMVVCWAPDRAGRELEEWAHFLNICRRRRVLIRVTDHGRTYDVTNRRDWKTLAEEGIDAADFSEKLSHAVCRGVRGSAKAGRPAMGPAPYGYRRTYDPDTGELTGQVPDPETAPIVQEIIRQVGKGVAMSAIVRSLQERGITPPGVHSHRTGSRSWYHERVRQIALNPVYAGQRRHRATGRYAGAPAETYAGAWPALVTAAEHLAAQLVLADNARIAHGRTSARPGKQVYLLTYLATCHNGHPLVVHARGTAYTCVPHGCVHISRVEVDALVEAAVMEALADPEVYGRLRQAGESSGADVEAAEAELARLTASLEDWRKSAWDGRGTTPATLASVEAGLAPQIEAARRRARVVGIPPALRPFLEPDADIAARWREATLQARRTVIRALCTVTVHPCPGRNPHTPIDERVKVVPIGR